MAELVPLDEAKKHAKLEGTDWQDGVLQEILDSAHERCLEYVRQRINADVDLWQTEVDAWTDETVLKTVKQAIRLLFTHDARFRGDDEDGMIPEAERGRLPMAVEACLNRHRDPTLA